MCTVRRHEVPIEAELFEYDVGQPRHSRNDFRRTHARPSPCAGAEIPCAGGSACSLCQERSRWQYSQQGCVGCQVQSRDPLGFAALN